MSENLCLRPQFDIYPIFCAFFELAGVDVQAEPHSLQFQGPVISFLSSTSFIHSTSIHGAVIHYVPGTIVSLLVIAGEC